MRELPWHHRKRSGALLLRTDELTELQGCTNGERRSNAL